MGMLAKRTDYYEQFESIEEYLLELRKYGCPRLSSFKDGTGSCSIDMTITGEGISFEIKSGFDEKTPLNATRKCYELMTKALKDLKKEIRMIKPNQGDNIMVWSYGEENAVKRRFIAFWDNLVITTPEIGDDGLVSVWYYWKSIQKRKI